MAGSLLMAGSNVDLRMTVDFRSVCTTMIQEWMGFSVLA
jgi:hypothetical protein